MKIHDEERRDFMDLSINELSFEVCTQISKITKILFSRIRPQCKYSGFELRQCFERNFF